MTIERTEPRTDAAHGAATDATALPATVAGLRAAIAPVLDALREEAGTREAERVHPYAEIRRLAELGVLRLRVPVEDGGVGGTTRDLAETVIDIARADSNVAQALRSSFLVADGLAQDRTPSEARDRTLRRVLAGDLFAGTRNEAGGGPGAIATRVRRDGDGWRVTGSKFYSTGGLHAQWFSGTAVDEEGDVVSFSVPTDRAGVTLLDDFDAVGQRLTASGTTLLEDAYLADDEVTPERERTRRPGTALPQLFLAAVLAGIAEAALDDAIAFARDVARPIKHSTAAASVDDPYVRHTVGDIAAHAIAARGAVVLAAEALQAAFDAGADVRADAGADARPDAPGAVRDIVLHATVTVASAQQTAAREALAAAELVFDVGGGRAVRREHHLDRHWRNARTVANHNPRAWKSAVVGAYLLTGTEPPDNGLF